MTRTAVLAAAALALAAALPAPPAAEGKGKDPKYLLKGKLEKDKVRLGEKIRLELSLHSASTRPTPVWKLDLGTPHGLVLYVRTEGGRQFQVSKLLGKYQGDSFTEDVVPKKDLDGGKFLSNVIELLAVRTGKVEITPVFVGIGRTFSAEPVEGKPLTVTVEPGPKGETKLGAKIRTDKGDIVAELFPDRAYNTVHNFLSLGQLGFYSDRVFHRVIQDFMVQSGCPNGNGSGGPGYHIPGEVNDLKLERGVVAMALEGHRNTGGSQFFILTGKGTHLEGTFTGFGKVVEGMGVLDALAAVPVKRNAGGESSDPVVKPKLLGVEPVLLK